MSSFPPASELDWLVTVEEPMPDCTDCQAAFVKVASPTKMNEWRSSQFAKLKITLVAPATEPLKEDDEYTVKFGPFTSTVKVLESTSTEDECVLDAAGGCCCGLLTGRVRFAIYKKDGVVIGKAQEKPSGCTCLFPPASKMESEHTTMFKELNDTFKSS